jgi:peptidoglycan/xylan/chitin deacetylase (PgdA/CDA1 family)
MTTETEMYDILSRDENVWNHFTRKEEYEPSSLDIHGRYRYENSHFKDIEKPIASRFLVKNGFRSEYPEGRSFAICLTHDVDDIYPPWKHIIASSLYCLKRLEFRDTRSQIAWKLKKDEKSPYLNFQRIIDLERDHGAKSTFFFLAGGEDYNRYRYELGDVSTEIGRIVDRGWEVGLHGGYYAYDNDEALSEEKRDVEKSVGRTISGYRGHYLRFRVPETWDRLTRLGFQYDSTLGYPDMVGFRNGMCHPFRPYDLNRKKGIEIVEIPMAIMDGTLFGMEKSYEGAKDRLISMIDDVRQCNGVLVINWHASNLDCRFRDPWLKLYKKILEYGTSNNAWITNGEEIVNHFKKNGFDRC